MANRKDMRQAMQHYTRRLGQFGMAATLSLIGGLLSPAAISAEPITVVVDLQSSYDACNAIEMRVTQYILVERLKQSYRCESLPWVRAQLLVKTGERDAMVTLPTEERRQYADASGLPVASLDMRLFVVKTSAHFADFMQAKTLDELKAGTFVSLVGSGWTQKEIQARQIAVEWAGNIENVFRMLNSGRGDFTIQGDLYAFPILKAMEFEQQIAASPTVFGTASYHLMLSKRSAHRPLLTRFDAELKAMDADGSLAEITAQFMQTISEELRVKKVGGLGADRDK